MITTELLRSIVSTYTLSLDGVHGLAHWARVLENGKRLAAATGADPRVVELFAVFHDSRRENDSDDPGHGSRGARLAESLRDRCFVLEDEAFSLLVEACERHTDGQVTGETTVLTCWDADRLDLSRCGIITDPRLLGTQAAREPGMLGWATRRAIAAHEPPLLREIWVPMLHEG